jgi:hypothetical protein
MIELIDKTSFPLKPLIIGKLTDEDLMFIYEVWRKPIMLSMYIEIRTFIFHERAFKVMERYPSDEADDQRPLLRVFMLVWLLHIRMLLVFRLILTGGKMKHFVIIMYVMLVSYLIHSNQLGRTLKILVNVLQRVWLLIDRILLKVTIQINRYRGR